MRIIDRLREGNEGFLKKGPVSIVCFGDSVTQGAFEDGVCDFEAVYHARLKRMLNLRYPGFPVNVINAGIGGITAKGSLDRIGRDVIRFHPDCAVVCFGLNDVGGPKEEYISALTTIFQTLKRDKIDTIFLTPNMLNTRIDGEALAASPYREYAFRTMEMQTGGRMDACMDAARGCAREHGIRVCDCYARWKAMDDAGEDTTALLANRINHPTRAMHGLFAEELLRVMEQD